MLSEPNISQKLRARKLIDKNRIFEITQTSMNQIICREFEIVVRQR